MKIAIKIAIPSGSPPAQVGDGSTNQVINGAGNKVVNGPGNNVVNNA